MALEETLTSVPPGTWVIAQVIVLDWYDGPRQGLCALAEPPCQFHFELLDERPTEDDLDDRLFRLSELPAGSIERAMSILAVLGHPSRPVWAPTWDFPRPEAQDQAERELSVVLDARRPTRLVIRTSNMIAFRGCWLVARDDPGAADWFEALGC